VENNIRDSYTRYLEGVFRKAFELVGTPLRVQYKQGANPFAEEDKPKSGEGIVSMRRRKTAFRAEMKARKETDRKK
jgi:GTP-binding protein